MSALVTRLTERGRGVERAMPSKLIIVCVCVCVVSPWKHPDMKAKSIHWLGGFVWADRSEFGMCVFQHEVAKRGQEGTLLHDTSSDDGPRDDPSGCEKINGPGPDPLEGCRGLSGHRLSESPNQSVHL